MTVNLCVICRRKRSFLNQFIQTHQHTTSAICRTTEGTSRQVHDHMTHAKHWIKGDELDAFRLGRRIEAVSQYLRSLSEPLRNRVLEMSTRTLRDVGIGAESLVL